MSTIIWWAAFISYAPKLGAFVIATVIASFAGPSEAATEAVVRTGADLIVAAIVPWWVDHVQFLSSLQGQIGAALTAAFLVVLVASGGYRR